MSNDDNIFGELRSLLHSSPSSTTWTTITRAINAFNETNVPDERVEETIAQYCIDCLSTWPEEIERRPPTSWLNSWMKGERLWLAAMVSSNLKSFYVYLRHAGSGSIVWSETSWHSTWSSLMACIDSSIKEDIGENADPQPLEYYWQKHEIAVFWCGEHIKSIDINNHVIFDKTGFWQGLRATPDSDLMEWEGISTKGEPIILSYDELLNEDVLGSKGATGRIDWAELVSVPLHGTPQQDPIELAHHADKLETALNCPICEEAVGQWEEHQRIVYDVY